MGKEMVRRQTKGKQAAPATVGVPRSNGADQGVPSLSGAPDQAAAATPGKRTRSDTVPCVRTSTNAEIMLAKHFLLNFSVVLLPPKGCRVSISAKEKNALGQCRAVLHLDQLRKTLEVVMKGTCVLSFKLRSIERFEVSDDEESYGAFPFLSIHYKTPTEHQVEMNVIVLHFQAFHEVEVCRDLLHNTLGGSPKQLSLQRSILRQGNLLKRGKSGIFWPEVRRAGAQQAFAAQEQDGVHPAAGRDLWQQPQGVGRHEGRAGQGRGAPVS